MRIQVVAGLRGKHETVVTRALRDVGAAPFRVEVTLYLGTPTLPDKPTHQLELYPRDLADASEAFRFCLADLPSPRFFVSQRIDPLELPTATLLGVELFEFETFRPQLEPLLSIASFNEAHRYLAQCEDSRAHAFSLGVALAKAGRWDTALDSFRQSSEEASFVRDFVERTYGLEV